MSIALAEAMLKPAVDAGVFSPSRDRSEKLRRLLLMFRLTSFDKYDAPSWDESAFRYDDARVSAIIAKADAGDTEAADLLRRLPSSNCPAYRQTLRAMSGDLLEQDRQPRRAGGRQSFFPAMSVSIRPSRRCGSTAFGRPVMRRATDSGCSLVAAALTALGVPMVRRT